MRAQKTGEACTCVTSWYGYGCCDDPRIGATQGREGAAPIMEGELAGWGT